MLDSTAMPAITWNRMFRRCLLAFALCILFTHVSAADSAYFPTRHTWERADPGRVGMDEEKLAEAVAHARAVEETEPAELDRVINDSFATREPNFRILGPVRDRAGSSGMIIKNGYVVAEWGDIHRVDMTFSVTKSYLSTVAALALADGLIQSVDDPVRRYVRNGLFDAEHNRPITWRHLLNQTSDWQGELFGVPDWADRPMGDSMEQWRNRELHEPGTHFKYNDVRVNLLALSLLHVYRQPLPVVLRERVMGPIGASSSWRWHGYENSWVDIDGLRMQSVSGGGHFGGGLFISSADHARFGLLFARGGIWDGVRLIPASWIDAMREPTPARQDYGFMWWLNTDREQLPGAPEHTYYAAGFGGNYIWIDDRRDLVVVLRWVPDLDGVVRRVLAADQ